MTNENNLEIENIKICNYNELYYKGACQYKDNKFQVSIKSNSISNKFY